MYLYIFWIIYEYDERYFTAFDYASGKVNQHVRNNGTKGHDWILRSKDVILWSNEIKSDVLKFCKLVSGLDVDFFIMLKKMYNDFWGYVLIVRQGYLVLTYQFNSKIQ